MVHSTYWNLPYNNRSTMNDPTGMILNLSYPDVALTTITVNPRAKAKHFPGQTLTATPVNSPIFAQEGNLFSQSVNLPLLSAVGDDCKSLPLTFYPLIRLAETQANRGLSHAANLSVVELACICFFLFSPVFASVCVCVSAPVCVLT